MAGGLPSLEHQLNFDIIMLTDRIQERITLKVMIHTLAASAGNSVTVFIRNTNSFILCVAAKRQSYSICF